MRKIFHTIILWISTTGDEDIRILGIILRWLLRICAVVGLIGIIVHGFRSFVYDYEPFRPIDNGDKRVIEKTIISPDNKYKAILFENYDQGNGAFMPSSCDEYISVIPNSLPEKTAWAQKYRVYVAQCSAPDLIWTSNSELLIAFDLATVTNGAWMRLQGYDQSFKVQVHFTQKSPVK